MDVLQPVRIAPGGPVDLDALPTRLPDGARDAMKATTESLKRTIAGLQTQLHAEGTRALLVVFQAMDTGGKDGAIRRVFRRCHIQGVDVQRFRPPGPRALARDFLWRVHRAVPEKGLIGVFNRSHYESVVTERVMELAPGADWNARFRHINDFERMLHENGTRVVKFFLHISNEEQRRRLQSRLDDPNKRWKFTQADVDQRARWNDFRAAYQEALAATSTPIAPWHIVAADAKWQRDHQVAAQVAEVLQEMAPRFPEAPDLPARVLA